MGGEGSVAHVGVCARVTLKRRLPSRHMQRWERLGSPTLQDLQLKVSYATETEGRPWKTLRVDRSVVAIDWAT